MAVLCVYGHQRLPDVLALTPGVARALQAAVIDLVNEGLRKHPLAGLF